MIYDVQYTFKDDQVGDNEEKGNNKDGVDKKEKEKEKEKERELTFLDVLFGELNKSTKINKSVILSFKSYLFLNEYDTDGLKYDISQNEDENKDNDDINNSCIAQFILLKKQKNLFKTIKQIIKKIGFILFLFFFFFSVFVVNGCIIFR